MSKPYCRITILLLLLACNGLHAQDLRFRKALRTVNGQVSDLAQDKMGIVWISTFDQGLRRYDGINLTTYTNDPGNPNSLAGNFILSVTVDKDNMIWMGMLGMGLEKFDPATNTFTHFRTDPAKPSSLSSDTVANVLQDHLGNIWVATSNGLDQYDPKTGGFIHYRSEANDPTSLSHREVYNIYEDKKGVLWVGCWPFSFEKSPGNGGLNRLDRTTGKFTRYLYDSAKPKSIPDNRIVHIYEDRQDNFWITTILGLYKMNRNTGEFDKYYADPLSSGSLRKTPGALKITPFISFIAEDVSGAFWIGLSNSGMNRYDPVSGKSAHFGYIHEGDRMVSASDTITGYTSRSAFATLNTSEGLFWVAGSDGGIFNLNYNSTHVPFYNVREPQANSFYLEDNNKILWVGTGGGLLRRDLETKQEKWWLHDPKNSNSLSFDRMSSMRIDEEGFLWIATRNGLDRFERKTETFTHYKHDPAKPGSISSNNLNYLFIDHNKNLWAASDSGISRMDKATGLFTNYKPNSKDSAGLFGSNFLCIAEDKDHFIWVSSDFGAFRLDSRTGKFRRYINNSYIKSICVDSKGVIWAGGEQGLYYYDRSKDAFIVFADINSVIGINAVINIIEDDRRNLWVSTSTALVRISADRSKMKKYTEANGVRYSNFLFNDNFKGSDGRLFLGEINGYYSFHPDQLTDSTIAPDLLISAFKLAGKVVMVEPGGVLTSPVWETPEIRLRHNQNIFSFEFNAIDYISPGDEKYLFMLENYDNTWRDIGSDRRAFFFNISPGTYIFRVKAVSGDGGTVEKSIRIIISPPWWKTWWAYALYVLLLIVAGYLGYKYQKSYIVKKERQRTQQKELAQAKEIERAYTNLKTTQAQLIQSEKMASLGELTAGIAHEIQNPLNFVNNFSEINKELLAEMQEEIDKGNYDEVKVLAKDVSDNQEKINHHGKRADAIVKGMLQHSRNSTGQKELTDINALADEYLRLAYHGMRAKDKTFNAALKTAFDENIGKINIVPQDIGRVILNLFNNAFYAVNDKKKQGPAHFEPVVSVSTRKVNGATEIIISDNGNGIPPQILDKIFQPFFTTKSTGQGTGLGLSLSYDIIKAHGGELSVQTREGEGSDFTILLPDQTSQ